MKKQDLSQYLIDNPAPEPENPSTAKSYIMAPGTCESCTLKDNCKNNKSELLRFLNSLGLEKCGNGYVYSIFDEKVVD